MTTDPATDRGDDRSTETQLFQGRALGSKLRLTLLNVAPVAAEAAWRSVLDEFGAVDRAMSAYREDSALSELNRRAGQPAPSTAERRLYTAISLADRAWRLTGGRFDGRVLGALRGLGRPGIQPVEVASVEAWPSPSGIVRDPRESAVALQLPLDLGGVGKGLALRWAWAGLDPALDQAGRGGLLEAGGDLVGRGPGPDGEAWLIGIDDPAGGPDPVAVVALESGGICTSSIEISTWSGPGGEPVHHLIDPRTGLPGGQGLKSVTVAAPDPAWAEIWSKTLFLAGPGSIGPEARSRGITAWWILEDGTLEMTPAARQRMRWP